MGGNISGIGTKKLSINGVSKLSPCDISIIPDRIEAGTYMVAAAMTAGELNCIGVESDKMVTRLADEEDEIVQVLPERRITLEYYKNGLINAVARVSLMAAAVRSMRTEPKLDREELNRRFETQAFLFRYEFTLNPEQPIEDLARSALEAMVEYGAISRDDDGVLTLDQLELVEELAGLTRNFVESYRLVLRVAHSLGSRDIALDELPLRVQEVGKGLLAVDEMSRPEALSLANLKNAIRAYKEEGLLKVRTGSGGLQFEEDVWRQYMDDLQLLLD
jgi:glycerol-3-phosphate O-acyltransferase